MAVAMDAAVASIGNNHDVKLKYTVELRALNIQHMKNTLMVQLCAFPGSPNHQTTKSPNHQITKPPNHQTTKSPNHQITKPPNHQTTKSPNHQITKPPNHQIPGVCVQVFRFSSQVWALMFGNSGSVFRFVFGYSHSVFIFR